MESIYLIGAGGHCVSCIDVIESTGKYKILGVFDVAEKVGKTVLGYPIVGTDEDLGKFLKPEISFLVTVGQIKTPQVRMGIYKKLQDAGARLATVISPRAYVSKHATVGAGTIIMHGAFVNANARVGSNCIVNTQALLEHDVVVEDHCHISTAAVVNGNCSVGHGSFVGSNSVLKEGMTVPASSVLGAGDFHR